MANNGLYCGVCSRRMTDNEIQYLETACAICAIDLARKITRHRWKINPNNIRVNSALRKASKPSRGKRGRIFKRDNHQCVYCGSGDNLTIDHAIPITRGGSNDEVNLVASCRTCNVVKGQKTQEEFLAYRLGLGTGLEVLCLG